MVIMKFSETQEHEMYTRYYIRSFYNGKAPNLLQPQVAIEDLLQKVADKDKERHVLCIYKKAVPESH